MSSKELVHNFFVVNINRKSCYIHVLKKNFIDLNNARYLETFLGFLDTNLACYFQTFRIREESEVFSDFLLVFSLIRE